MKSVSFSTLSEYVYIFDFENRIKIGKTIDVKKRLRSIENSSGQRA